MAGDFCAADNGAAGDSGAALVSGWHEGWNPTREDAQDLADEARGIITVEEYLACARQRAERARIAG